MRLASTLALLLAFSLPKHALAASDYEQCLLDQLDEASSESAETLKQRCKAPQLQEESVETVTESQLETADPGPSAVVRRAEAEDKVINNRFVLTPHRPNYFLPITYNAKPQFIPTLGDDNLIDKEEVHFQLSVKFAVINNLFDTDAHLMMAYTTRSFWQAFNSDASAPFRDTNHEPEIFLAAPLDFNLGPVYFQGLQVGINHQSNGRSQLLSRSWNRVYADLVFGIGDLAFSLKPWYRVREDTKETPFAAEGDDNPDIEKYLGHFELVSAYSWDKHTFSAMVRNNLRSDNYGALQLNWSFPMGSRAKGYLYFFDGYGESLLDYNHRNQRLGFGIVLTDWL